MFPFYCRFFWAIDQSEQIWWRSDYWFNKISKSLKNHDILVFNLPIFLSSIKNIISILMSIATEYPFELQLNFYVQYILLNYFWILSTAITSYFYFVLCLIKSHHSSIFIGYLIFITNSKKIYNFTYNALIAFRILKLYEKICS